MDADRPSLARACGARRIGPTWALAGIACACGFNSSGVGSPGGTVLAEDTGDPSAETSGADGSGEVTTEPVTTAEPTDTGAPDGPAMLVLADAPEFDFVDVVLGEVESHGFVLRNEGTGTAVALGALVEGAPFTFSGGSYPGTGGTCSDTLVGADSCVIVLACAPNQWGETVGALHLHYDDPLVGPGAIDATLRVRGVGETVNLLENGDAEQGGNPPAGWVAYDDGGSDWQTVSTVVFAGTRSIYAGEGSGVNPFRLRQSISVDPWVRLIEGEGLSFRVRAQTRASDPQNDLHEVRLRFFDGNNELITEMLSAPYDGTAWNAVDLAMVAPAGTRLVQVQLRCERAGGMYCDAFFDDVSLVASYP